VISKSNFSVEGERRDGFHGIEELPILLFFKEGIL